MTWRSWAACLATLAILLAATPSSAQSIADHFRGKTLRLLLPTLPGGGRVLYALPFAAHFGKHLPGNPTVLPVYMPGAGGAIAVNNAYTVAAPDGLTIVSPLAGVVIAQALGEEAVKYDVAKLNWIGRITDATRIFFVSGRLNARTLDDFRRRQTVVGATGRASDTYLNAAFMNKVFGTRFKIVTGYPSAGKMNLSVEAGETEGAISTWNDIGTYHPNWVRDGVVRVIVQIALTRLPQFPDVPLLVELAGNDTDRELTAFMSSSTQMGQSFAAPPGVPAPVVAALRKAFDDTMSDPAFVEKIQSSKLQFNPMGGEELARSVVRTIGAPKWVIERYKAATSAE